MIKTKTFYVVLLCSICFFAGCAHTIIGNRRIDDIGNLLSLRQGQTTKMEIYNNFGQPHDVEYSILGESRWDYFQVVLRETDATKILLLGIFIGGIEAETKIMKFYFDVNDILKNIESTINIESQNMWVAIAKAGSKKNRTQFNLRYENVKMEMDKYKKPLDEQIIKDIKGVNIFFK